MILRRRGCGEGLSCAHLPTNVYAAAAGGTTLGMEQRGEEGAETLPAGASVLEGGGGDKLQGHLCAIRWEGDRVSGEGPRLTELASSLGVLKRSRLTWLKL